MPNPIIYCICICTEYNWNGPAVPLIFLLKYSVVGLLPNYENIIFIPEDNSKTYLQAQNKHEFKT